MNFIWLIFAHFIGDFSLQGEWMAKNKSKYWYVMLAHCFVWTACISVALEYVHLLTLWKIFFLISGHFVMDKCKCLLVDVPTTDKDWWFIYPDQLWHLGQCFVVYWF